MVLRRAAMTNEANRRCSIAYIRAPAYGDESATPPIPNGTVSWSEHLGAWREYAKFACAQVGDCDPPARVAELGGFTYREITQHLGHEPTTWRPLP
jgi:hypothetical protein